MKTSYQFLILCPALLTGCASVQVVNEPAIDYDPVKVQSIVEHGGQNRFFVNGVGDVSAGSQYIAASGRICRKLSTLDGESLPLRSCQGDTGQWYTTRSLSESSPFKGSLLASDWNI